MCCAKNYHGNREQLRADFPILVHPMDKTDNYIKRCVAISGQTIQLKKGRLYVDGNLSPEPENAQTDYKVITNGTGFDEDYLTDTLHVWIKEDEDQEFAKISDSEYYFNMRASDTVFCCAGILMY